MVMIDTKKKVKFRGGAAIFWEFLSFSLEYHAVASPVAECCRASTQAGRGGVGVAAGGSSQGRGPRGRYGGGLGARRGTASRSGS